MSKEKILEELTLLLIHLTSWKEGEKDDPLPIIRAWKGYDFDVLDKLKKNDLINFSYKAKSLYLTDKGLKEAKKLQQKYLKNQNQ